MAATPLLSEMDLGGLRLRTRTARSATWECLASESGEPTPALCSLMASMARSGVGLIVTGFVSVRSEGKSEYTHQLSLCNDQVAESHRELVRAVHDNGGLICAQIGDAGRMAPRETRVGPSADDSGTREATPADIDAFVAAFAAAAARAQRVGYDAVQLHACHGSLVSQFLDGSVNKRSDDYGGSLENRARLVLRIVGAVRAAVGPHYPVFAKLNTDDYAEGGLTVADSARVAVWLADAGVGMLEASSNAPIGKGGVQPEGFHREGAAAWRRALAGRRVAVCLVGGIRDPRTAQGLIDEGVCDMVAMSRPFIREPDVVAKWRQGTKSACVSCNGCWNSIRKGTYCCPPAAAQAELSW
eukprot:m51a1_g9742 hypothetical protein (357) ;mRNA; r:1568426-1569906